MGEESRKKAQGLSWRKVAEDYTNIYYKIKESNN
jgi:hypothetical protein